MKKILIAVIICVVIFIGVFTLLKKKENSLQNQNATTTSQAQISETSSTQQVATTNNTVVNGQTLEKKNLWDTFALYLSKAADHDIPGVAALSFELSDTCKDEKLKKECFAKMDAVHEIGSQLKQEDFVNIWEDKKQAILSTVIRRPNTENALIAARSTIIFTKDAQGNPKLLALNPNEMWQLQKNKASTTAELETKMLSFFEDSDQDGVSDNLENCIFPDNVLPIACKKTNPKVKDSNGDGWWDGIEPLIAQ